MKFSTRARYGLRLMVELARALQDEKLVQLGQVAEVTGISGNYLAQLAMSLKSAGLIIGVSGKKGGYQLGRAAERIKVSEILEAVQGPIGLTDCAKNPELCLNSGYCEARMVWVIAGFKMMEVFEEHSLADLIASDWKDKIRREYSHLDLLDPARFSEECVLRPSCPATEVKK